MLMSRAAVMEQTNLGIGPVAGAPAAQGHGESLSKEDAFEQI